MRFSYTREAEMVDITDLMPLALSGSSRSFRFFASYRSGSSSYVCAVQPKEVYVDDESKLTLHGLVQHFIMLTEPEKNRKLCDVLDALDFNQVEASLRRNALCGKTDDVTGGHLCQIGHACQRTQFSAQSL